jgi:hypothetical protein
MNTSEMLRTICVPQTVNLNVSIPENYIGSEVEILVFPIGNVPAKKTKRKIADEVNHFFGIWKSTQDESPEEIVDALRTARHNSTRTVSFDD